jgi:hypothetical protein
MRKAAIFLATLAGLLVVVGWFVIQGLSVAILGWQSDPVAMVAKVIFSLIFGQGVFWLLGYDQLGIFMSPFKQLGFGQTVANWVYDRIPATRNTAWAVKGLEILADFGKVPFEGAVYIRYGFVSDGLAALVTQPLWSTIETAEKLTGAIVYPERVFDPDQIRLSLGCIYGSLFRYGMALVMWFGGSALYGLVGTPIEHALHWALNLF